jgi:hypothetical protein
MGVVCYLSFPGSKNRRLVEAEAELEKSIREFGHVPLGFPSGKSLQIFGDVLEYARSSSQGTAFVWCNTDVKLVRDPYDVPDADSVYGFRRTEVPSGEICLGVDMYYIPTSLWDSYLARDIPQLYVGASYVDRWMEVSVRAVANYRDLDGYIEHRTHERSQASGSDRNKYYQRNFRSFNAWAKKRGFDPIPAPHFLLPGLGHVWGVRDAIGKTIRILKGKT